ncbi:hypothetical protein ACNS7O_16715 (plasmid) [Haloferacaceae archaeon DSL9]
MEADTSEDHQQESLDEREIKPADKIDRFTNRLNEKVNWITPSTIVLLQRAVKIVFGLVLTALLVYWGLAYTYDVAWFEF